MKKRIMVCIYVLVLCALVNTMCYADGSNVERMDITAWSSASEEEKTVAVQELLIKNGYLYGEADGIIGDCTESAIIKYKKYNNITPLNSEQTYALYVSLANQDTNACQDISLQMDTYEFWQYTIETADERGVYYDYVCSMLDEYDQLLDEGKTGTKAFSSLKQELIPEGYDENYIELLKKYFDWEAEGVQLFIYNVSQRDSSVIEYSEKGDHYYWTVYNKKYALNKVCMTSELDVKHTIAVIGKLLDSADEYVSDMFSWSWDDDVIEEIDKTH